MTSILIVDDHEIVREGIHKLVEQARPDWDICGEAGSGAKAIEMAKTLKPDVIILDIAMPQMSGFEAASRISRLRLGCRVLLFTMYESKNLTAAANQAGAQGFVLKSQAAHHLVLAIERIMAGGTFFGGPEGFPASNTKPKKSSPFGGEPNLCTDLGFCGI